MKTVWNKRKRQRGAGGERSPQERHAAPSSGPRGPLAPTPFGLRTIETRRKLRPTLTRIGNTVTGRELHSGSHIVPWSERGCVWWWRSGGPCCQAARERRGPGMAGSCSTLRCGRCGRPRRALHATGPRTARARSARPARARPHSPPVARRLCLHRVHRHHTDTPTPRNTTHAMYRLPTSLAFHTFSTVADKH